MLVKKSATDTHMVGLFMFKWDSSGLEYILGTKTYEDLSC